MPRRVLLTTLIAAIALLLLGCAARNPVPITNFAGFANWDCGQPHPYAFVRVHLDGFDLARVGADGGLIYTAYFAEIVAHELAHVEQMRRYGCEEWHRVSKDPAFRRWMEREAECRARALVRRKPCDG
jgi:hypothetical protein